MRTNLDFTARSALVSSPAPALSSRSSSYSYAFFSSWAPALALSLGLKLSVSYGKDYLESAAACKRLSDKRAQLTAMRGPRPLMTTKSAPINGACYSYRSARQSGEAGCYGVDSNQLNPDMQTQCEPQGQNGSSVSAVLLPPKYQPL